MVQPKREWLMLDDDEDDDGGLAGRGQNRTEAIVVLCC